MIFDLWFEISCLNYVLNFGIVRLCCWLQSSIERKKFHMCIMIKDKNKTELLWGKFIRKRKGLNIIDIIEQLEIFSSYTFTKDLESIPFSDVRQYFKCFKLNSWSPVLGFFAIGNVAVVSKEMGKIK